VPGLFGVVRVRSGPKLDRREAARLLDEMAERLRHHAGYRVETWISSRGDFAIGRIGFEDIQRVPWPFGAEDGPTSPTVFVDGVLHREVLGDDPASALADIGTEYSRDGLTTLRKLSGFYSMVIYEPRTGGTTLLADRHASHPMCVFESRGWLYFAPEAKAFLVLPHFKKDVDPAAIGLLLSSGFLLSHQTLFKSVRRLKGGEALIVEQGSVRKEAYWRYFPTGTSRETDEQLCERLAELLQQAVARNFQEPEKTALFLSGGVDSRAILGAALAALGGKPEKLHTVTWGRDEPRPGSDVEIAGRIAAKFRLNHHVFRREVTNYGSRFEQVNFITEGLSDVAAFHPHEYTLMQGLRDMGFRVVLRGDNAFDFDIRGMRAYTPQQALVMAYLRNLEPLIGYHGLIRPRVYSEWCEASAVALQNECANASRDLIAFQNYLYFTHRLQGYLNTCSYFKLAVVDQRNPLFDEALLDFMQDLPNCLRIGKVLFHRASSTAFPRLFNVPFAVAPNLEDWPTLVSRDSPVRRFVSRTFAEPESAFSDCCDFRAVKKRLAALATVASETRADRSWRRSLKSLLGRLGTAFPSTESKAYERYKRRTISDAEVLLRLVVVKHWFDLFLAGDGRLRSEDTASVLARGLFAENVSRPRKTLGALSQKNNHRLRKAT